MGRLLKSGCRGPDILPGLVDHPGSAHGLRRGRDSSLLAAASSNSCFFASHFSFLPVCRAITPMWQTITELPPTTALQIGCLRFLTHSTKFCMWLVGRPPS